MKSLFAYKIIRCKKSELNPVDRAER